MVKLPQPVVCKCGFSTMDAQEAVRHADKHWQEEATEIYEHPKGHTKEELQDCLDTLNRQDVYLNDFQFEAIKDAIKRLLS